MNDERMQSALDEWFEDTDPQPPNPQRVASNVLAGVPRTRQRGRWLPFRLFRRNAPTPTVTATSEYQPSSVQASNGHAPTVIGRTSSMLSPVKAITAGALVFAIGGAFLIARPFEQQSNLPGAEVHAPPAPVPFTSTYTWSGQSNYGTRSENPEAIVREGVGWLFSSRESSDPRFAGPLVQTYTEIEYPEVGGSMSFGGYRIETDEGAWQQVPTAGVTFEEDASGWASGQLPPADNLQFWTFIGEGEYDGLTAVVQETWWPEGADGLVQFDGYIFEGDLWDAPEPWVP